VNSHSALATHVNTAVTSHLIAHMSNAVMFYGSQASLVKSIAPWAPVATYSNTQGTVAGPSLPTQDRALISWKTDFSGRAYRGRTYMFTPTNFELSAEGRPSGTYLLALQDFANQMIAPFVNGPSTWVLGLWHRKPTADIGSSFDQFTAATVSNSWASQRRSGDYGRPNSQPF
jgi:hypothetical protein